MKASSFLLLFVLAQTSIADAFTSFDAVRPLATKRRLSQITRPNVQNQKPSFIPYMLSEAILLSDAFTESAPQLSKETTVAVFVVGVIPFAIATYEFWRRIAVGASFGTNDPVVFIGEDDAPSSSRGKQVLGKDSLITAYIIFAVVIAVLGLVIFSVLTSPDPDLALRSLQ